MSTATIAASAELADGERQPAAFVPWRAAAFFVLVALLLRMWLFGNPVVHIDEQFYLLMGDRMLSGTLPYVDIWDRKPIGLFLIYAFACLSGDGTVQYQVLATVAAGLTAFTVFRIALHLATPRGAVAAGVAYLLYLLVFNGAGGQSPVFYNLPMAVAALILVRAVSAEASARALLLYGAGVMALVGVAIQIKYTVVFEGVYFGCVLLWMAWRGGVRPAGLAGMAAAWASIALLPSLAAWTTYWSMGEGDAFVHANFLSIFGRRQALAPALGRLAVTTAILTPFWLTIFAAPRWITAPRADTSVRAVAQGWAVAAVAAYVVMGGYYDHYALALLPALCVVAAPMLGHAGVGHRFTALLLAIGLLVGGIATFIRWRDHGSSAQIARMTAMIPPGSSLFLLDGDPVLYKTMHARFVTRYVFTSHLTNVNEAEALGIDVRSETQRILKQRPEYIVMVDAPRAKTINQSVRAKVQQAVDDHYQLTGRAPVGVKDYLIYRQRPRTQPMSDIR